jgi:hypothetical protein
MAAPKHIIVLIHGIRTAATWQERAVRDLSRLSDTLVIPIRYGFLDVIRFWLPGPTRRGPISRVTRELRSIRFQYPSADISVVAHSFGTYIFGKILASESDIAFSRAILCGSIIPPEYRWDLTRSRVKERPLNDCGTHDIWPVLAKTASWGYGASGTFGFGSTDVVDRFFPFKHSDFFAESFIRDYWYPYFFDGTIARPEYEFGRGPPAYWKSFLVTFPLKTWVPLALGVLALLIAVPRLSGLSPVSVVTTPDLNAVRAVSVGAGNKSTVSEAAGNKSAFPGAAGNKPSSSVEAVMRAPGDNIVDTQVSGEITVEADALEAAASVEEARKQTRLELMERALNERREETRRIAMEAAVSGVSGTHLLDRSYALVPSEVAMEAVVSPNRSFPIVRPTPIRGGSGWIFAGYADSILNSYIDPPRVAVHRSSARFGRPFFEPGDVATTLVTTKVYVLDYARGREATEGSPITRRTLQEQDETGVILPVGAEVVVRQVSEGHLKGSSRVAIWLRVSQLPI